MLDRTLYFNLWKELSSEKEMIFLSGPRQVGKTTLAKQIAGSFKNNIYYNWDIISNKKTLIENPSFFENIDRVDESIPLVILDEIHKYKNWKNYLKGAYDQFHQDYIFLVSGSGRLDLYQKGGDSLAGRYLSLHLFPLTVAELSNKRKSFDEFINSPINVLESNNNASRRYWQALFELGGFPEPFVKGKKTFWTKWSANYARQIIYEDIRNFSGIKKVSDVEILFSIIPSKTGSPMSINNLAGDIQVAFDSVKSWLRLFELFYLTFAISPWSKKISRAITKEKKVYLFNYPEIQNEPLRFENMAAVEILRAITNWNERGFGKFSLHYIRNKEKEEVDFLIADSNKPVLLIETKMSDDNPAKALINFQNILNIPAVQLVNKENVMKYIKNGRNKLLIATAHRWLSSLP